MKNTLILSAALLGLSACGGGSGIDGTPATPVLTLDPFFALVRATASTSDDASEPAAVEVRAVSAPDDAEPSPLDAA